MTYILKNTSGLINTRLTDTGRQKLSQGNFNIEYFQIGDGEVSYNSLPSSYNQGNTNIFEPNFNSQNSAPTQSNKQYVKYPYYVDGVTGNTYGIPYSEPVVSPVYNRAAMRGFFTGDLSATTINWSAITNSSHVINSNYVVDMSVLTGGTTIMLIYSGCNTNIVRMPAIGDLLTIYYDGNGEHNCACRTYPTPSPTPSPTPTPDGCIVTPTCTPTCTKCTTCDDCRCTFTGFTSVENTCESDPLFDSLSNALSFRLCGDPKNPQIGVRALRITGDCETTGSCSTTGVTFVTGYTVFDYCTPPIYPRCLKENPAWLNQEHWFQVNFVWERYNWLDDCDLFYRGGLSDITKEEYLESLSNNTISLITVPYTSEDGKVAELIKLVKMNDKWITSSKYRKGRLKIYINGQIFHTIEDFEEVIPRALSTDKEKQVGVPFNVSWGGGTQGLRENLTFSSTTQPFGPYVQDPECLPTNDLTGTTFNGLKTNILIEQNFAGTFEGAISQFRMYTEPLSAPEVKHNFKILNQKFEMFNPDCPDCSTSFCEINDFTYVISDSNENKLITPYSLGRVFIPDERDNKYLIENKLTLPKTILTSKYWDANGWWGNQGNTPQCVGYAWAHWIEDGPVGHDGVAPIVPPTLIYREAQKVDEWIGEKYEGTSVRGAAKYLRTTNRISSYLWTYDINVLINTVLNQGPVVVGTNWYSSMFTPDRNGVIRVLGRVAGGHAYVINGVDRNTKLFRIKNSWGKTWGKSGHAYISFTDMTRLIRENGEVCLAIENKF